MEEKRKAVMHSSHNFFFKLQFLICETVVQILLMKKTEGSLRDGNVL